MFVRCECCVLSGRGLCDKLITCPEESYRLCCVVVCDLETSRMGAPYIYDISRLRVKSSCKVSYFNQIGIFLTDFHKRPKCQFKKIRFVGAELIHADMTKLIGTFHMYVKMAKKHMHNNYEPLPTMHTTCNPIFLTLEVTDYLPVLHISRC